MNSRGQQFNLLKFFQKIKGSLVWGCHVSLCLTLLACSGFQAGGGGGPDSPFAGGALDGGAGGGGGGGGGQFTGGDEPGGQVTEDGVIREAPKAVLVKVQNETNGNKSLMRFDQDIEDAPMFELPSITGPYIMVSHTQGQVYAIDLSGSSDFQQVSMEGDEDGEQLLFFLFPTPSSGSPCQNHYNIWACQISNGKYYESQVLQLSCPVAYGDNPYGTRPGDPNTTLFLHEATAKPCPNPAPQPAANTQTF